MQKEMNIRSVLVAAGNSGCLDGSKISSVVRAMHDDGYKGVSEKWVCNCESWAKCSPNAMKKIISQAVEGSHWFGEIKALPEKYSAMLSNTAKVNKVVEKVVKEVVKEDATNESTKETSSAKKMNLRTLLCNCYENQIFEASVALDILAALSNEYEVSERDKTFSEGWRNWGVNTFKKMVENTYNGANGFAKAPLLECDDFKKFIPLTQRTVEGENLNARTILNKFWESKNTDGVAIAAALVDATKAGYKGINYDYHSLIGKQVSEVQAILDEAHNGKGVFSSETLLDNCPNF